MEVTLSDWGAGLAPRITAEKARAAGLALMAGGAGLIAAGSSQKLSMAFDSGPSAWSMLISRRSTFASASARLAFPETRGHRLAVRGATQWVQVLVGMSPVHTNTESAPSRRISTGRVAPNGELCR